MTQGPVQLLHNMLHDMLYNILGVT